MKEYLIGLKEIWRILLGERNRKKIQVVHPQIPRSDTLIEEVDKLNQEIVELKKVLQESLGTLREWERVNRHMLYPHQHNTGSINRETINKITEVL